METEQNKFVGEYSSEELVSLAEYGFPKSYVEEAKGEIEDLIQLIGEPKGKKLLDIPCGVARHSFLLAKAGFNVTGVDFCQELLQGIEEKAKADDIPYETVKEDMRSFERSNYYDVIISLWDSLGMFEGIEDSQKILSLFYKNLKSQGCLILENYPLEYYCTNINTPNKMYFFRKHTIKTLEEKNITLVDYKIYLTDDFKRIESNTTVEDNVTKERHSNSLKFRVYSIGEMTNMLLREGFVDIKFYSDFKRTAYTQQDIINGIPVKIVAHKK